MFKRRDVAVVVLTALTTGGLVAVAQTARSGQRTVMKSSATEWNSIEPRNNANGSSRKFFEGPSPTLDLLECHASTLNPGKMNHEILKRTHDEVIIVKEGTVEAYVGDKWVKLGPGSVIFNAANEDQAMRNSSDAPATYHVVMARPPATAAQQPAPAAPAMR